MALVFGIAAGQSLCSSTAEFASEPRVASHSLKKRLFISLPHFEQFDTYELALARVPVEFRPSDEQL